MSNDDEGIFWGTLTPEGAKAIKREDLLGYWFQFHQHGPRSHSDFIGGWLNTSYIAKGVPPKVDNQEASEVGQQ